MYWRLRLLRLIPLGNFRFRLVLHNPAVGEVLIVLRFEAQCDAQLHMVRKVFQTSVAEEVLSDCILNLPTALSLT